MLDGVGSSLKMVTFLLQHFLILQGVPCVWPSPSTSRDMIQQSCKMFRWNFACVWPRFKCVVSEIITPLILDKSNNSHRGHTPSVLYRPLFLTEQENGILLFLERGELDNPERNALTEEWDQLKTPSLCDLWSGESNPGPSSDMQLCPILATDQKENSWPYKVQYRGRLRSSVSNSRSELNLVFVAWKD